MENNWKFILGIDVSKLKLDMALKQAINNSEIFNLKTSNNLQGFDKISCWLKEKGVSRSEVLICLENTGIYHRLLVQYLLNQKFFVWVETPVQIKWSGGLQRGKSDLIDAERIMNYAYRNQDKAKGYKAKDSSLQQISDLLSARERLQTCIHTLMQPIKELKAVGLESEATVLEKACRKSYKALNKNLKEIDDKIITIIEKEQDLKVKYDLTVSVTCVGFVAACYLLVYTQGFTRFDSAKQLASYAGIAPFEFSSGTSIKGRTKVHSMGNKTLKKVLHMCAISSIRHNEELKAYFARKVGQGKNKMLVINAIRNKIIGRVFSCVKNQRKYTLNIPN